MPQEIATRSPIAPTPQTREFRDLLGVYKNKIETTPAGRSLTSAVPTGVDLARIEGRRRELVAASQPTDPGSIVPRIARLFLRFPSAKIEDPAGTTAAYATDLASFPLWAIEAGIMALLRGHGLESKSFAPSSIIVREAVVREVAKVDAELAMINCVLGAKSKAEVTRDPVRKATVLNAAAEFVSGHRMADENARRARMTPAEIADAQALSREVGAGRSDLRPMPPLSPYLRNKLGLRDDRSDHTDAAEDAA